MLSLLETLVQVRDRPASEFHPVSCQIWCYELLKKAPALCFFFFFLSVINM